MYQAHWKLREKPFENTPDPHFIYYSQRHEEALSRMLYAVRERKGAALLTGECGSGKTLLSRVLLQELSSAQYESAIIINPKLPVFELIKEIVNQLGSDKSSLLSKADVIHQFNEILYRNENENKHTVVIIDEAQSILDEDSFEELRLLLNFQLNDKFLLTIFLLGQPELKETINNLPQLKERISVRYHLVGLSEEDTKKYIQHRLKLAGSEDIFQDDAHSEIYRFSGGIPRKINNICDMALLVGYGEEKRKINSKIIRVVAEDQEEIPIIRNKKEENVCYQEVSGNIALDNVYFNRELSLKKRISPKIRSLRKKMICNNQLIKTKS